MVGKLAFGVPVAIVIALIAPSGATAANDFTELRTCEVDGPCETVASVPVGVGDVLSNNEDFVCQVPLSVPLSEGTEVRTCERTPTGTDPRRTLAFVRVIAAGHDVAIESIANGGALISDYSLGARVDTTRVQAHSACSQYPDPYEPESQCVP